MAAGELTRRAFLRQTGFGVGALALGSLFAREGWAARAVHHPSRARQVIFLHMVGGPSTPDLFDAKPVLQRLDGQPAPKELIEGQRFAFLRGHPKIIGSRYAFSRYGESGMEFSELLPNLGRVADRLCRVRSCHTDEFNHAPAQLLMHTGFPRFGRPSMGAWVDYGLGSENDGLPAYVVMVTGEAPGGGTSLWGPGFLPSQYQGTELRSRGEPVFFLSDPPGVDRQGRRRILDAVGDLNREQLAVVGDPEIAARIEQYELAFRMQRSVPELVDFSDEDPRTLEAYGARPGDGSFASNCLLARRLVERGVRFVELFDADWDHHYDLHRVLPEKCEQVDRPVAALIEDLAQRGLLDETLVVFCGEFGRTPMAQEDDGLGHKVRPGRDHHRDAFTVLMAGGGTKAGLVYGATDELGYGVAEKPVHVHDLQATWLHLLGIDHERHTYKFMGRDFRLTDVAGEVVHDLLA